MKEYFQLFKARIINQKHSFYWLFTFFCCAFIWFLFFSPSDGLWYDECFTLFHSQGSLEDIIKVSTWDSNPPLYLILVKKWLSIVSYSEFNLRFLGVLFSATFISFGAFWIKKTYGIFAGLFVFFMLIFSEVTLEYAHEARVYSMLFFLIVLNSFSMVRLVQKPNILIGILIGVINSIIFFSHYIEGIIVLIQCVFLFFVLISKDFTLKNKLKSTFYYLISLSIFLYFVNKWKFLFLELIGKGGNNIVPPPQWSDIPRVIYELLNHNVIFSGLAFLIFLFGCYQLLDQFKTISKNQKWTFIYFILLVFVSFTTIYIVSYKAPMFCRRYLMFTLFSLFSIVSIVVSKLKNDQLKYALFFGLIVVFISTNSFQTSKQMQVKNAVNFIKKHKTSKTLVIVQSRDIVSNFALYYNFSIFRKYFLLEEQLTKKSIVAFNDANSFLKSINLNDYEKVFLFQVFENAVDPQQSVLNYLNDELQLTKSIKSFRGIKLIEFSTQSDSYTSSNSLKNGNKLQLNFYKQKIVSDVNWFAHIEKKAKIQNMSLDSTLTNECLWLIKEDENNLKAIK